MMPVGTYVSNGQTLTWQQPPEGVEPVPPYTPTPAPSSNCVPFQSNDLFPAVSSTQSGSGSQASGGGSGGGSSGTGTQSADGSSNTGAASTLSISFLATISGVLLSTFMFA